MNFSKVDDLSTQSNLKSRIGSAKEIKKNMYFNIKETLNQSNLDSKMKWI